MPHRPAHNMSVRLSQLAGPWIFSPKVVDSNHHLKGYMLFSKSVTASVLRREETSYLKKTTTKTKETQTERKNRVTAPSVFKAMSCNFQGTGQQWTLQQKHPKKGGVDI